MCLVHNYVFLQRHPDGVVSLAFKEFEAADMCVAKMNNRWYAGRQLDVAPWDGLMDFQVHCTHICTYSVCVGKLWYMYVTVHIL